MKNIQFPIPMNQVTILYSNYQYQIQAILSTFFGCGMTGHIQSNCSMKEKSNSPTADSVFTEKTKSNRDHTHVQYK